MVFIDDPKEIEPVLSAGGTFDGLLALKDRGVVGSVEFGCVPGCNHFSAIR